MPISGKLHQRNNTDLIDNKDKNIKKINKLKKTNNNFKIVKFHKHAKFRVSFQ